MVNISIDQLAAAITQAVKEYTDDVTAAVEKEVDSTSKAVLDDVKAGSPVGKSGGYKKGWRRKRDSLDGQVKYTIHNKDKPGLVHLLEDGHAKRGGGRVAGKPHVKPAYDSHVPAMEDRIKQIIRNGG
jgi:hypothetical protein